MKSNTKYVATGGTLETDSVAPVISEATPRERQRQMETAAGESIVRVFAAEDAPDLTLTARAMVCLGAAQIVSTEFRAGIIQMELEKRDVEIPTASLYGLLDRLAGIGFLARREEAAETGGRARVFYKITHCGRVAVSLGQAACKARNNAKAG